jgi:hypothetical protein
MSRFKFFQFLRCVKTLGAQRIKPVYRQERNSDRRYRRATLESLEHRVVLASNLAFNISSGSALSTGAQTLGYSFSTSRPLVVDGLGAFDYLGDGFNGQIHATQIWTSGGSPIGSTASINSADPGVSASGASGVWRVKSIPIIELGPGSYVIGSFYNGTAGNQVIGFAGLQSLSGVSYSQARYFNSSSGLIFPFNGGTGQDPGYFGPTFRVADVDYGDAPTSSQTGFASSYPTRWINSAARHVIGGPRLGALVDADDDGQPSSAAAGDDLAGSDDEDGVTFLSTLLSRSGTGNITVNMQGAGGSLLNAWIDFNRDGDWNDIGEQIFANRSLNAGDNALSFSIPAGAATGTSYARFRVNTAGGLLPTGLASDGEVEDYAVTIVAPPTATNLSAAETYVEDSPLNLTDIVVSDVDSTSVTATLTLSAPAAGSLNIGTSGAVTSTYNAATGVWTASGAIADVNTLLAGLTFTPTLNYTDSFTITTSVSDGAAAAVTGAKTVTGTAVNDMPVRTAGTLTPINVNEDSVNSSAVTLGLGAVTYGPGGGTDESSQTLTYTVTAIPAFVQLFKADGTTPVLVNTAVTGSELQGLNYKTVADANGMGDLTWTVADNGTPVKSLIETLEITVNALNDAPVRTAGTLTPINVHEDSVNSSAVTLGLSAVTYGPGGGADESSQTLTYSVMAIPAFVQLFKADGTTPVLVNTAVTGNELQGLTYKTVADANGMGDLTWTVADNGTPVKSLIETLEITVNALNDAPVRTAGTLTPINVNEDSVNSSAVTLGLGAVTYGPGGGTDESSQTLTYTVTAIPAFVQLFKADGTTPVLVNTAVTGSELQGLNYKTVADANGMGDLTWTVADNGTPVQTLIETLGIAVHALNDAPVRTAGTLTLINVNEDSVNSSAVTLGLGAVTYGPGGGADESSQTLTYTVTAIPAFVQLFKADGTTPVLVNTAVTGNELQGLTYKTVADANGIGDLTWTVADNGTPVETLTENLSVTVSAVNDAPVRTAGTLTAINVNEDSANSSAVSLGLGAVTYGPGGGADESSQTLTYTVTAIPAFVLIFKADGTTPVLVNDTVTGTELQGLTYKTVADANGIGNLTWTVTDDDTPVQTLTETLGITVNAVNDAPVRTAGTLTPINVNEDSANSTAVTLELSAVTYGPGGGTDESSQTLTYTVTAIPAFVLLFKADGTTPVPVNTAVTGTELQGLKYKTVADAYGTGNVTWTVADNGSPVLMLTENLGITVNDVIDAPPGSVQLMGGPGNDRFTVVYSSTEITVDWSADGGPVTHFGPYGLNTALLLDGLGGADSLTLALTPQQIAGLTTADIGTLKTYLAGPTGQSLALNVPSSSLFTSTGFESADLAANDDSVVASIAACFANITSESQIQAGTGGPDTLTGTSAADLIFGGDGDDLISGLDGADCLLGGAGHDSLLGGSGDDRLEGGSGNDSLVGDLGFDWLRGGLGNDTLDGGLHDDQLDGGPDVDTILGGPGYDIVRVRLDEAAYDSVNGGDNTDSFLSDTAAPVVLAGFNAAIGGMEGWIGNGQPIFGTESNDNFTFLITASYSLSMSGVPYIDGRGGDDILYGTNGVDVLRGGEGNDTLLGLGGVDTLFGDAGNDSLNGGDGVDHLYGGDDVDTITTGAGRDIVYFVGDLASLDTLTDFALYSDSINLQAYAMSYSQVTFTIVAPNTTINLANGKKIRLNNWNRAVGSSQFKF